MDRGKIKNAGVYIPRVYNAYYCDKLERESIFVLMFSELDKDCCVMSAHLELFYA